MITVVNKHKEPKHIYCGRGSALGNPFKMSGESERDSVCEKYEAYFHEQVEVVKNETMLKELRIIYKQAIQGNINLGCYCSPKRCHCDTIKKFIECKIENKLGAEK
ncbi:MAG: hypothetical protein A3F91_09710 [Flavobacteria bacterium RIFCSPLOWO2_12_FULL_35_11]|nr:MAG: hypothetical protein A3F91_09710 [Flavobacteria bacterium RIFCSPLOWO2_12_FULL_35_11]